MTVSASASQRPVVTCVAAVSKDGFISRGRGVPWDLPRDKAHFRAITAGQWVLVGRVTYEEMLGWFQNRHPLVMTHRPDLAVPGGQAVRGMEQALDLAQDAVVPELFVLGGGGIFAAALPWADRLVITQVDDTLGGGVPFPPIEPAEWEVVERRDYPADAENSLPMAFVTYVRSGQKKAGAR